MRDAGARDGARSIRIVLFLPAGKPRSGATTTQRAVGVLRFERQAVRLQVLPWPIATLMLLSVG